MVHPNLCTLVPQEAKFDEPQYVKGVVIYSLIKWNHPAKHLIHEATVWVEKEDGQLKQCGVSIGEGVGEVSAPVNMVWCDEIATKVRWGGGSLHSVF